MYTYFFGYFSNSKNVKKKDEKKISAELKWATAHLSIGAVSQYNHCIVT